MANEMGHLYLAPDCTFWENFGAKIRIFRGLMKHGTANQQRMDQTWADIDRMKLEVVKFWPASYKEQPGEFAEKVEYFLVQPRIKTATGLILATNGCLSAAVKTNKDQTHENYKDFLLKSLEGSASVAHSLLK